LGSKTYRKGKVPRGRGLGEKGLRESPKRGRGVRRGGEKIAKNKSPRRWVLEALVKVFGKASSRSDEAGGGGLGGDRGA